ncbi:hypothetical protein HHE92_15255 [Pseudoalteromonas arctica]|uniref:hypothetical protein n=1 Tax=Pseudoalteromonas arctica TaxID=394751 RepID=UPI00145C2D32|nr:hypothetical protein [Pseudoalteromonas arctica]NMP81145.1 hypothetical protein [Pseudoalteromonas arctica]
MRQFILGLILASFGALASWIFAQYKLKETTGYLEYITWDRSSYVQLEDELFRKIKFQYKDDTSSNWKDIPNISVATIKFENSSKKHLDDVEVIFEMNANQGSQYSLIGVKAQGPKGYDEKYITKLNNLSDNAIGFNFETINISSDEPEDHFSITFLFAGNIIPQIVPKVVKKGVKIRALDRGAKKTAAVILVLVAYAFTIILFFWWALTSGKKNSKRYQKEFDKNMRIYLDSIRLNGVPKESEFIPEVNRIRKESGRRDGFIKKVVQKVVNWANS